MTIVDRVGLFTTETQPAILSKHTCVRRRPCRCFYPNLRAGEGGKLLMAEAKKLELLALFRAEAVVA